MKRQDTCISLSYHDDSEFTCPREALEHSMAGYWDEVEQDRDYWREVIAEARRSSDPAEVFQRLGGVYYRDPPEGTCWFRWAEWVEERLTEAVEHPETLLRGALTPYWWYSWRRRASTVVADVPAVLARLGNPERAGSAGWPQDGTGPVRWHVIGDTGSPVGWAVALDDRGRAISSSPTTWAEVVLKRTAAGETRLVGVGAVEPDADVRAPSWRERWPALHAVLGGWFSETAFEPGDVWLQQAGMLFSEPARVLDRVVEEGNDLLTLDDADLRAATLALGCAAEFPHLRLWLEWMFWRTHRFDWK